LETGRLGDVLEGRHAVLDALVEIKADRSGVAPGSLVVVADDDIGQAIAVDVGDAYARGSVFLPQALPAKDLAAARRLVELALAVVEVQAMIAVALRQKDVGPAIVVDVRNGHAKPRQVRRQADVLRDVGEAVVAEVVEQGGADLDGAIVALAG